MKRSLGTFLPLLITAALITACSVYYNNVQTDIPVDLKPVDTKSPIKIHCDIPDEYLIGLYTSVVEGDFLLKQEFLDLYDTNVIMNCYEGFIISLHYTQIYK